MVAEKQKGTKQKGRRERDRATGEEATPASKAVEEGKQRGEGGPEAAVGGGEEEPSQPSEGRAYPQT